MAIYTNRELRIVGKPLRGSESSELIQGVVLGGYAPSRGGRTVFLPTPKALQRKIECGRNQNLAIGMTHSGRLRINTVINGSEELYLLISSRLDSQANGHGRIRYLRTQHLDFICRVRAAQSKVDNEKTWAEAIIKAKPGDALAATWCVESRNRILVYYVDDRLRVHEIPQDNLAIYCRDHGWTEMPFTINTDQGEQRAKLVKNEWAKL